MDVLLLCQFSTWTFCDHLRWFAYLDGSPLGTFGRFDTRTFRYLPGRLATCLKVCNLRYCKNFFVVRWRNIQGGSKMSWYRNVQRWETSRWRNVQVAKHSGSKWSKVVVKRPGGGKVANHPITENIAYQGDKKHWTQHKVPQHWSN